MRPPRAQSPRYGRRPRHDSLRQRCPDQHTGEIIHFVRELQFERQPTLLRLQKKAPLPGIGQSCNKAGTNDSGFLDRGTDSMDSDDDSLDNEIAQTQKKVINPRMDPFFKDMLACQSRVNTSNDYEVLSRSVANGHTTTCIYRDDKDTPSKVSRQNSFGNKQRKNKNCKENLHGHKTAKSQLPPLARDDIPDRPSAPSPSRTPPTSDCDFIEEEPVDYLDLS